MVALIHLHGVAQCAGGPGNNGDLLHRGGIGLLRRHQRMADLVISHDALFVVRHNGILLLITGDDHLNALFQIRLGGEFPPVPDSPQSGLVHNVGKLCAGCAGGHTGDLVEINILSHLDLLGVDLQNFLPALQVRKLHRHPTVEPSGTGQGGVQRLRTVGGCQNHHALASVKAVHLC